MTFVSPEKQKVHILVADYVVRGERIKRRSHSMQKMTNVIS